MAQVTIHTCDICQSHDGVASYAVVRNNQTVELDLCSEHNTPLEELLERGTVKVPRKRRARRSAGANVTTMEEIERLKQTKK